MGARDAHATHRLGDLRHWGRQARTRALTSGSSPGPCAAGQLRSPSLYPHNIAVVRGRAGRRAPAANQSRTFNGHARASSSVCPGPALADSTMRSDVTRSLRATVVASPSSSRGSPSGLRARSPRPAAPTTSRLALGSLFFLLLSTLFRPPGDTGTTGNHSNYGGCIYYSTATNGAHPSTRDRTSRSCPRVLTVLHDEVYQRMTLLNAFSMPVL